jgi:hypothetical protein
VKKGAPGLKATKIQNKIGLRMVQNGDILLNKVFVPEEDRLTGINSFQDISKVHATTNFPCSLLAYWNVLLGHLILVPMYSWTAGLGPRNVTYYGGMAANWHIDGRL